MTKRPETALDMQVESWSVVPLDAMRLKESKLSCPKCGEDGGSRGWHTNATQCKGNGRGTTATFVASTKYKCSGNLSHSFLANECIDQLPERVTRLLHVVMTSKSGLHVDVVDNLLALVSEGVNLRLCARTANQSMAAHRATAVNALYEQQLRLPACERASKPPLQHPQPSLPSGVGYQASLR